MPDIQTPQPEPFLDAIPDPDTVRNWLAQSIRESALLRCLLRVAERKAILEARAQHRETAHDS